MTILCGNKRIIQYLQNRPHYPTLFCNATMANNWDVLEQTHHGIEQSGVRVQWHTITEYRNTHRLHDPPPFGFDQTLSDTRDRARTYLIHHPEVQRSSPFLPASRCMVLTSTSTIHSDYNMNYRESATVPALKKYLQERNQWSQETMATIEWDLFRMAVRSHQTATPNHLTKLVYNQLATPANKAKSGGQHWSDPTCPHCHQQPETFDHLLRCDDTDAITFRMMLPKAISTHCHKFHAPEEFHKFLLQTTDRWLSQPQPQHDATWSQTQKETFDSQSRIGWTNFSRGFLTIEWSRLITENCTPEHPLKGSTASFFSKLIGILWSAQTAFWTAYQERRHAQPTDDGLESAKLLELQAEVEYLFTLRDKVLPAHTQTYFPQDESDFIKYSTHNQLQTYIHNYGNAIRLSIKQHQTQSVAQTPSIFTFPGFQRVPTNALTTNNMTPDDTPIQNMADATDTPALILEQPQEETTQPAAPSELPHQMETHAEPQPILPPPIPPPPNIPPPAPDEPANEIQPIRPNARQHIQRSILDTFRRRRTIREITPPTPTIARVVNTPIHYTPNPNNDHLTVGDYISQMHRHPNPTTVSTTDTEDTNTPPVIATRASSNFKHSKWRPAEIVRAKFSQYFRK